MRRSLKKICLGFLSFVFIFLLGLQLAPITASADTAPKPSVNVKVVGIAEKECYATLLSSREACGPYQVWREGLDPYYKDSVPEEIFMKFVEYKDADGYYFLQPTWKIKNGDTLTWGYYPPDPFKLLLYFPQSGTFVASGVYERYAFDSYFEADVTDAGFTQNVVTLQKTALKEHNLWKEALGLVARIFITLGLEIGLAFAFKIRKKNPLLLIVGVNVATQLLLNTLLNLLVYFNGYVFIFTYALLEFCIFIAEALVYFFLMGKMGDKRRGWIFVLYALSANLLSLGMGLLLSPIYPPFF